MSDASSETYQYLDDLVGIIKAIFSNNGYNTTMSDQFVSPNYMPTCGGVIETDNPADQTLVLLFFCVVR